MRRGRKKETMRRLNRWWIVVVAGALACGEHVPESDDPFSPAVAGVPTFVEHLDASGAIIKLTPAEGWNGAYPIRIVRQNPAGEVVSEQILARPPTFDLSETIRQMTPAQREKMKEMLETAAAQMPASNAGLALDEVTKILERIKR